MSTMLFLVEVIPTFVAMLIFYLLIKNLGNKIKINKNKNLEYKNESLLKRLVTIWFVIAIVLNIMIMESNPRPGIFAIILLMFLIIPIVMYFYLNHLGITSSIATSYKSSDIIRFQIFRVIGGFFLIAFMFNQLSGYFAIPAGLGDIITGFFAMFFGKLIYIDNINFNRYAVIWNSFGLLDLIVAIVMGILTNPGPFQISSFTSPQLTPIYLTPLVIIPTFIVPVAIIMHIISLQNLRHNETK